MNHLETEFEGIKIYHNLEEENKEITVSLIGYLDSNNSPKASAYLNHIPKSIKGINKIVLDLKELNYASSTGIGSLTSLLIICKKEALELELLNPTKKILDVISLLGFTSFFHIKETV